MMIAEALADAVKQAIAETLSGELYDIVVKETRRAVEDHEEEIAAIVRAAVRVAIKEALREEESN